MRERHGEEVVIDPDPEFASVIARWRSKGKQGHRWAGALSFENPQ
jgi:hypothetical protein